MCVWVCVGGGGGGGTIWYKKNLSNNIGPFINPLKSIINSAYSYSSKSKYEQLI